MSPPVVSLEERLALSSNMDMLAKTAGITRAQARMVVLALSALEDEQLVRIVAAAREDSLEAIHRIVRREEAAEKAKQEARSRREAKR